MSAVLRSLREFSCADEGLVTVEWVAIAASVIVGGIVLVWLVMTNINGDASSVGTGIGNAATATVNQPPP